MISHNIFINYMNVIINIMVIVYNARMPESSKKT